MQEWLQGGFFQIKKSRGNGFKKPPTVKTLIRRSSGNVYTYKFKWGRISLSHATFYYMICKPPSGLLSTYAHPTGISFHLQQRLSVLNIRKA
jgi:hypothetical protein